jgi:dynein heavy chain
MFERFFPDILKFFQTSLQGIVNCNDISLSISVLRLLDTILTRALVSDESFFETAFVFCVIWGFGSVLHVADDGTDYRKVFSEWFRIKFKSVKIPARDTIFDYWLDTKTCKFESWNKCPAFRTIEFGELILKLCRFHTLQL